MVYLGVAVWRETFKRVCLPAKQELSIPATSMPTVWGFHLSNSACFPFPKWDVNIAGKLWECCLFFPLSLIMWFFCFSFGGLIPMRNGLFCLHSFWLFHKTQKCMDKFMLLLFHWSQSNMKHCSQDMTGTWNEEGKWRTMEEQELLHYEY